MTPTKEQIESRKAKLEKWRPDGLHPSDCADAQAEVDWEIALCSLALQALSQPAEGWRGIDSAPKDGTSFLAFLPCQNHKHAPFMVMRWSVRKFMGVGNFYALKCCGPSRWQPLPSPPQGTDSGVEG